MREAASVNIAEVEEELKALRIKLVQYPLDYIFNMDETALFWKMTPDSTLAVMTAMTCIPTCYI